MQYAIEVRTRVMSGLLAILIASSFGSIPARAAERGAGERSTSVQLAQGGCRMFGPYATMRRANEVAYEARSVGFNAIAYHNGDGYYVKVC